MLIVRGVGSVKVFFRHKIYFAGHWYGAWNGWHRVGQQ